MFSASGITRVPKMLRGIVRQVTPLAERTQVALGVVLGRVVEVGDRQHDVRQPDGSKRCNLGFNSLEPLERTVASNQHLCRQR